MDPHAEYREDTMLFFGTDSTGGSDNPGALEPGAAPPGAPARGGLITDPSDFQSLSLDATWYLKNDWLEL